MSQWFRMYEEILDDPKVQRLSPALFKLWVNVLALTARYDGHLPSIEDCAFAFRVTENDVSNGFMALENAGLLKRKGSNVTPHGWEKRQFTSDTSTPRVKRFRERQKERDETPSESDAETESETEDTSLRSVSNAGARKPQRPFERFWEIYPHKVGKRAAEKAFSKAMKRGDLPTMVTAIERYRTEKPEDRQWANPATWLNQDRWLDQPARAGPVDYSDLASETLRHMQAQCSPQPTLNLDSPRTPCKSTSS